MRMIGTPPTLEWVPIDRLQVDPLYQRSTESKGGAAIIAGMNRCWDWRLCQPLNVSRRDDGSLWVVDGQHRLEGARKRGDIPHLPCVMASHADHADEAQTFVALNRKRQRLSAADIFNADLAGGSEEAARVKEIITGAGLTLAPHSNYATWKPAMIFCPTAIQAAIRQFGEPVVRNAIVAFAEAYAGKVLNLAGTLLPSLYLIYSEDAKRMGFDPDRFIEALGSVEQRDWHDLIRDAQRQNPTLGRRQACALAMMKQYDALRGTA